MNTSNLEKLIKESLKDVALRMFELNDKDRKSLLFEYKEWIINKSPIEEVLMLPYEAYTKQNDNESLDDSV